MNSDEPNNLQPWSDPELEARVVALVLGEASDFEREDLERLLTEEPELRLFKGRIEEVHGLLGAQEGMREWKLSDERREKVLAAAKSKSSSQSNTPWWAQSWFLIAASVVILAAIGSSLFIHAGHAVQKRMVRVRSEESPAAALLAEAPVSTGLAGEGKPQSFGLGAAPRHLYPKDKASDGVELTKSGAGTLTLSGGNSFSRGTAINAGTLAFSSTGETVAAPSASPPPPPAPARAADRPGGFGSGGTILAQIQPPKKMLDAEEPAGSVSFGNGQSAAVAAKDRAQEERSEPRDAFSVTAASPPPQPLATAAKKAEALSAIEKLKQGRVQNRGEIRATGTAMEGGRVRLVAPAQSPVDKSLGEASPAPSPVAAAAAPALLAKRKDNDGLEPAPMAADAFASAAPEPAPPLSQAGGERQLQESTRRVLGNLDAEGEDRSARLGQPEGLAKNSPASPMPALPSAAAPAVKAKEAAVDIDRYLQLRRLIATYPRNEGDERQPEESPPQVLDGIAAGNKVFVDEWKSSVSVLPAKQREPAPTLETSAATEPFSTFSLHVSDVSFKLAQSALTKTEWPVKESVRIEEFVNAFDYGDPSPGESEPVVCQIEQSAHPFAQQRNLVRFGIRTAAVGRGASTPLRLTVLLDSSGSMERPDRRATVKLAFERLAGELRDGDEITLITFARQPRLVAERANRETAANLAKNIASMPSEGGTNLEAALVLAAEKARATRSPEAQNRIVLLTDGAANLGDADATRLAEMIHTLRQDGIAFDAAGIGADGLNDTILEALTRKGDGRYYLLDRPEDADEGFARKLAGAFRPGAKDVKVQIQFNPDRVGRYRLLGFEEHRLNKEDFRDDTVDAAEMASEEAGVALYQVEVRPDGSGDVGYVSVRFLDVASGERLERRWLIPYEPGTPGFDQANPSLRLAGLSAWTAAKLKDDGAGAGIDWKDLARIYAALPGDWKSSGRVRELGEMLRTAEDLAR